MRAMAIPHRPTGSGQRWRWSAGVPNTCGRRDADARPAGQRVTPDATRARGQERGCGLHSGITYPHNKVFSLAQTQQFCGEPQRTVLWLWYRPIIHRAKATGCKGRYRFTAQTSASMQYISPKQRAMRAISAQRGKHILHERLLSLNHQLRCGSPSEGWVWASLTCIPGTSTPMLV